MFQFFLFVGYSKCWCCSIVGSLISEGMTRVFGVFPLSHIAGASSMLWIFVRKKSLDEFPSRHWPITPQFGGFRAWEILSHTFQGDKVRMN